MRHFPRVDSMPRAKSSNRRVKVMGMSIYSKPEGLLYDLRGFSLELIGPVVAFEQLYCLCR